MIGSEVKKLLAGVVLAGAALAQLWAGVPANYYSKIDGEKKADLKSAVKACISAGKKTLSYDDLFEYYERTDVMPGTTNQVFDYYNTQVFYFTGKGSAPSGMNKEHSCPQSWWGGKAKSACYSDLFNVLPSESNANSAKSNYPLGVVDTSSKHYSNPHMKAGNSATKEYTGKVFEPCDEFKGDFARIYFYVATMYDQAGWDNTNVTASCAFNKNEYPTIKSAFIKLLLKWHREDPVSEWEVGRNDRVYKEQNNRNPFIDYPQLAEYIWGDSTAFAFDLQHARINGYGAYVGGTIDPDTVVITPPDTTIITPPDTTIITPPDTTIITPPDTTVVPSLPAGTVIFSETFADAEEGSSNSAKNCSSTWDGNANFPKKSAAYQAGGAIKLGASSKGGSLTSRTIDFAGGACVVKVMVKGWTTVEDELKVSLTGASAQSKSYSAKMADAFEEVVYTFEGVSENPKLILSTSKGRCFVDNVEVLTAGGVARMDDLDEEVTIEPHYVDLMGRSVRDARKGLQVRQGKLIFVR